MRAHRIRLLNINGKTKAPSDPLAPRCLSSPVLGQRCSFFSPWNLRLLSGHNGYYLRPRSNAGNCQPLSRMVLLASISFFRRAGSLQYGFRNSPQV